MARAYTAISWPRHTSAPGKCSTLFRQRAVADGTVTERGSDEPPAQRSGNAFPHFSSWRAITIRWIWLVPS
jgi:hypothetical protein